MTPAESATLARIEAKLDLLARTIGGDTLVLRWEALEIQTGRRPRTFPRKRVNKARKGPAFDAARYGEAP